MLFLSFLEAKGWLDGDRGFLARQFDACMASGGGFDRRVLRPLFFGTLNTPRRNRAGVSRAFGVIPFLNGGLFARTSLERRSRAIVFSDEAYGNLLHDVFGHYRFTAREESVTWTEVAIDPEMLGRAFESLMTGSERQRTGAFFTPFPLVEQIVNAGLEPVLARAVGSRAAELLRGDPATVGERRAATTALEQLTVLDPACGSGAFLVHALERIATLRARLGPPCDVATLRRDVLTRSIFGVDVNPTAVWLCELRLWLSVVIESTEDDPAAVLPLPNLDRNVRVGDALSGRAFDARDMTSDTKRDTERAAGSLGRLRERYANASGARKDALLRQLDRAERERALFLLGDELAATAVHRRDLVIARRGRDLFGERYRPSREERERATALRQRAAALRTLRRRVSDGGALPFSFSVHFADVAARGGFGLVIGNPPWIRLHRVAPRERALFRREYEVARAAAWEPGATPAGAGRGFAAQVDVAALFIERSLRLLAPAAPLALLAPVKLWRSLAGGGVRALLAREATVRRVDDYAAAPAAFDAAVYPSLVVAERNAGGNVTRSAERGPRADARTTTVSVAVHHHGGAPFTWRTPVGALPLDETPGAPWLLLPPDARRAFDRLRRAGRPLAESPLGRPHLGVKCGCNEAFIIRVLEMDGDLAEVEAGDGHRGLVERALLRPVLRGEQLARWHAPRTEEVILWTHDAGGAPLAALPTYAARWLQHWRRQLAARSDARQRARWWQLFRTEGARADGPRVVWGDVGREPRASVLAAGDPVVPINSCYIVRCHDDLDARAFAALLNGPLARAWLDCVAEPARGGYRRYLGWTLALLPVPRDWLGARQALAALDDGANPPGDSALLDASLAAYGLARDDVAALVTWALA